MRARVSERVPPPQDACVLDALRGERVLRVCTGVFGFASAVVAVAHLPEEFEEVVAARLSVGPSHLDEAPAERPVEQEIARQVRLALDTEIEEAEEALGQDRVAPEAAALEVV